MERLKGKTILIGRDPGISNLLVAIQGGGKSVAIGNPGSVPYSVSRCRMDEGVAHAKIEIDNKGELTIYNMNASNSTFVDGVEVSVCRISPKSNIELGKDRFKLKLNAILEGLTNNGAALPVDISHLKGVWEDYEKEMDRIVKAQQDLGKKRMLPIMVSSASGILSGLGALVSLSTLWVTLPVTGVVSALYFRNYNAKDTSYEDRRNANNDFQLKYVCPVCNHFLGNMGYELLKNQLRNPKDQKMYCPKCKSEFFEKE